MQGLGESSINVRGMCEMGKYKSGKIMSFIC